MDSSTLNLFAEGINLVLSRWMALQMAVENAWGGGDSRQKSSDLAASILSFFSQSKDALYIDELEDMLILEMAESFNTELEDGSEEEVAEQLMVMHEDFLEGNFESIEKLRKSIPGKRTVAQSKQVINDDAVESSDEEASDMIVDEPAIPKAMAVEKPKINEMSDEEGWSVVVAKRNRGRN